MSLCGDRAPAGDIRVRCFAVASIHGVLTRYRVTRTAPVSLCDLVTISVMVGWGYLGVRRPPVTVSICRVNNSTYCSLSLSLSLDFGARDGNVGWNKTSRLRLRSINSTTHRETRDRPMSLCNLSPRMLTGINKISGPLFLERCAVSSISPASSLSTRYLRQVNLGTY